MKLLKNKLVLLSAMLCIAYTVARAQDSVKHELLLGLNYHMPNNKVPFLKITAREKVERQFIPQPDITANIFMGEQSEANLLGKVKTDKKGEAIVYIPASFKESWDSSMSINFFAVSDATKIYDATSTELTIAKAKIQIDTITEEDVKKVIVKVTELKGGEWLPAKDVELKVAVNPRQ